MKRFFKYLIRTVLAIFVLLFFAIVLLYMPVVQNYIRQQAVTFLSSRLGWEVNIGKFSVSFPLDVAIEDVFAGKNAADTILYAQKIKLNIGIGDILRKKITVDELLLRRVKLGIANDSSGMLLNVDADSVSLVNARVDLAVSRIEFESLYLSDGRVFLRIGEKTAPDSVAVAKPFNWIFAAGRIGFNNVDYRMESPSLPELAAGAGTGYITGGMVNLGQQDIAADSVEVAQGYCNIRTASSAVLPDKTTVADKDSVSAWTVRVASVQTENSGFSLMNGDKRQAQIILSGILVRLDSVYNRGTVVRAALRDLQVVQQGGVRVERMKAGIDLDTAQTLLSGAYIRTENSEIRLDAGVDAPVTGLTGEVPLNVRLDARLGLADLKPFYDKFPESLYRKSVNVNTEFSISTDHIRVGHLEAVMPGNFRLSGKGRLSSLRNLKNISGTFELAGDVQDVSFLNSFIGGGMAVPKNMTLSCNLKAERGTVSPHIRLCQAGGCLTADAGFNMGREEYNAEVRLNSFPLGRFLPDDSLGLVTAEIRLSGRNFSWAKAEAQVRAEIRNFEFKGHDYHKISLEADLKQTHLTGLLKSEDPSADLELRVKADSAGKRYAAELSGNITQIDLARLNFTPQDLAVGLNITVKIETGGKDVCSLHSVLDQIQFVSEGRANKLGSITLDMDSDPDRTSLDLVSGDFRLAFRCDTALAHVAGMFASVAGEAGKQMKQGDFDLEKLQRHLPVFSLDIEGAENNTISKYLKARNIGFKKITIGITSPETSGIRINTRLDQFYLNKIQFDSIVFNARQEKQNLAYSLDVGNSTESLKDILNLNVSGILQKDCLRVELKQKDRQGQTGFDLGFDFMLRDSTYTVSLFPMAPIIGYERWALNADNRISFGPDRKVRADLRLSHFNKLISLQSLPDEDNKQERLQITVDGIDLGNISKTLPFVPDISGIWSTDLLLYTLDDRLGADGDVEISDFYYEGKRIGSLDLKMNYTLGDHFSDHAIDFELQLDSVRRALMRGKFSTAESEKDIYADIDFPSLPLYVVNVFLPDQLMELSGELVGRVRVRGTAEKPLIEGGIAFKDGQAKLVMLGTTFGLDSSRINIRDSKIVFDRYRFFAPNKSALFVNGGIDLASLQHIKADLALKADNFQVVDVKANPHSLIYGKAYANVDAAMKGEFNALSVTGNVSLLNNTVVDYTLRSSGPEVKDRSLDLVRFVSFRDTTLAEKDLLTSRISTNNFGLRLLVDIGNNVKVNVNLSEDGGNKVSIQGGGNLIYSMQQEGGTSLVGKYTLTGGTVQYTIPFAGQKIFGIQNGSYVEWTGELANPRFNISASESVKVSVLESGQTARLVNFDAIIRIQNTLQEPDITFDLSTPSDMVVQNQLATYSPEERTKLAMNLLITGTYTPPGATAPTGGSTANNALNSFLESELNQWSQKYLKNTGLSLGVDTYNTGDERTRTDYSYQFNKQLFNDKVNIKIGGRISTDSEPGESDAMGQNLVDDIAIEYVFDKNRNLFLKVFRHTNYESVLEGEVTQTGVGVVLRKSFRKVRDVFVRKSKREQQAAPEVQVK